MSTRWWTCSHCTFVNERRQDACEMCNKSRYAQPQMVFSAQPQVVFTTAPTYAQAQPQVVFTTQPPMYPTVQSTYNYRPTGTFGQPTVIMGMPTQPTYMTATAAPAQDEAAMRAEIERKVRLEVEAKMKVEMEVKKQQEAAQRQMQAQMQAAAQLAAQQQAQQQAALQQQQAMQQQQAALQQQQAAQQQAAMQQRMSLMQAQAEAKRAEEEKKKAEGDVKTEIREIGWKACVKCQSLFYMGPRRQANASNGACPAGGAHSDSLSGQVQAGASYGLVHQPEFATKAGNYVTPWFWCKKCGVLFIDVDANTDGKCGVCAVDKKPHESDIKDPKTLKYSLSMVKVDSAHEAGWVWCHKCSCLMMKSAEKSSRCPAGGTHDGSKGTKNYSLMIMGSDDNKYPWGEGGWRWCGQCRGLWYAGTKRTAAKGPKGVCPASASKGGHDDWKQSQNYWPCADLGYARRTGNYFEGWRWCGQCGSMFIDVDANPDGKGGACPCGGQHVAPKDSPVFALTDKLTDSTFQGGWCWCYKCSGLFIKTDEKDSRCPAGGAHDSSRATRTYGVQTSAVYL